MRTEPPAASDLASELVSITSPDLDTESPAITAIIPEVRSSLEPVATAISPEDEIA
jgi:hypothetical protein